MDGRRALLRSLIVASIATSGGAANLLADDFIRPPAKTNREPVRSSAITQPLAPVTRPAAVLATPAPATAEQLELDSKPTPSVPVATPVAAPAPANAILMATPAQRTVPAQTASTSASGSPLNWHRRGGRPSLSVDPNESTQAVGASASPRVVDALSNEQVPQVPTNLPASEVRLVLPARPEDLAAAEQLQQRRELAARISNEIVGEPKEVGTTSGKSIEPGPGWQAVGDELKQHVRKCEELLARRAYLSAMQEADQAIVRLTRVLDLKQNRFECEPTWAAAQQALREAQEFTSVNRLATDSELFTRIIQSHETPILKDVNVSELTPLAAAQHYRAYAEQCLTAASQGHPWFCELYYCLGRSLQAQAESLQAQAESNPAKADGLLHQSITYFRAAQSIDPSNVTNVNQLSYVLLRLDRPAEAFQQLQQIVQQPGCPLEAWQNLAQASSRLGDSQSEKWAIDNYLAAKSRGVTPSGPENTLVQVSEEQFRAMSPRSVGPSLAPGGNGNLNGSMAGATGNMQMMGPMNTGSMSSAPGQSSNVEPGGRTAILPRTGLFR